MAGKFHMQHIMKFSEVATALRMSDRSWSRHWRAYVRQRRFPAPMLGTARQPRWLRDQVEAWIAGQVAGGDVAPAAKADVDFERRMEAYANG